MITLEQVDLTYRMPEGGYEALTKINLSVPDEKTLSVVGVSGSGKTSLLHVMAGLLRPSAGQVTFNGEELSGPRSEIAVVFQDYGLFPWKTLAENVGLPLRLQGEKQERAQVDALLMRLGVTAQRDRYPAQLSGGERQRTAIGRAVIGNPRVLLMDEPFSSLDLLTRQRLREDIILLCEERRLSCVLVTHSIEEALLMGDRVAVFAPGGRVIAGMLENEGRLHRDFLKSAEFLRRSAQIRSMLEGTNETEVS